MYSYSIYEALQNIEHEATGVFKDRPEGQVRNTDSGFFAGMLLKTISWFFVSV